MSVTWSTTNGFNKQASLVLGNGNLNVSQDVVGAGVNAFIRSSAPAGVTSGNFKFTLARASPGRTFMGVNDGSQDFTNTNPVVPGYDDTKGVTLQTQTGNFYILKNGGISQGPLAATSLGNSEIRCDFDTVAKTVKFFEDGVQIGSTETLTTATYTNWYAHYGGQNGGNANDIINTDFSAFSGGTGTTYNDTLSESLTGAFSLANALTTAPSLAESLTSATSLATTLTTVPALTEALTAADTAASTAIFASPFANALTAADSLTSIAIFPNALAEGLTTADFYSGGANTFNESVSESLTSAASLGVGLVMPSALSEAATASDAASSAAVMAAALNEAAHANDNAIGLLISVNTLSEPLTAHDSLTSALGQFHPDVQTPSTRIAIGSDPSRRAVGNLQTRRATA